MKKRETGKKLISLLIALAFVFAMPAYAVDDESQAAAQPEAVQGGEPEQAAEDATAVPEQSEESAAPEETAEPCAEITEEVSPETPEAMDAEPPASLSGDYAADLLAVAYSRLGSQCCADEFAGRNTDAHLTWDACFVAFCLSCAGVSADRLPSAGTAEAWVRLLELAGVPLSKSAPKPGDLIFLDWDENNNETVYNSYGDIQALIPVADHVGIVTGVSEDGEVWYIIGDGEIREDSTRPDDESVIGYASLPEKAAEEEITEDAEPADESVPDSASEADTTVVPDNEAEAAEDTESEIVNDTAEPAEAVDEVMPDAEEPSEASDEMAVDGETVDAETVEADAQPVPRMVIDTYALAPDGYLLLRVCDDLDPAQTYFFGQTQMLFTADPLYLVNSTDAGGFVTLIPEAYVSDAALTEEGLAQLEARDGERIDFTYSADVNGDGAVNIADANAVYQMIQNGGSYYGMDQISLEARLRLQYRTISDYDRVIAVING